MFLISLLFFILIFNYSYPYFLEEKKYDFSAFEADIDSFMADVNNKSYVGSKETENAEVTHFTPFNFDPNTVSGEELSKLGLGKKIVSTIQKYRSKGGRFKSKEDFRKIYGMSDSLFNSLEPFLIIAETEFPKEFNPSEAKKKKIRVYDINSADSAALTELKGIGSVIATRIIRYRKLLGGFHHPNQLLEVYGFTPQLLENIKDRLYFNKTKLTQININNCSAKELDKLPYLNYNQANSIVQFRKRHGEYRSIDEVIKSELITDSILIKIAPYLLVE